METNRFEFLLDRYLNGPAIPEDAAELERLLQGDAELRRQFADRFLLEVQLRKAYNGIAPAPPAPPSRRDLWPVVRWLVAAMIFLAVGIGLVGWLSQGVAANTNEVVAGEVRIDGVALKQVPEEKWFDVAPESPAVIRLADGSQAEIAPASKAMIHGRREEVRQAIELDGGGGKFKVTPGPGQFRVETAVGTVTALGTEFSVKLEARGKDEKKPGDKSSKGKGAETPSKGKKPEGDKPDKKKRALAVSVMEWKVRVETAGKSYDLAAGEQRVFPESSKKEDD